VGIYSVGSWYSNLFVQSIPDLPQKPVTNHGLYIRHISLYLYMAVNYMANLLIFHNFNLTFPKSQLSTGSSCLQILCRFEYPEIFFYPMTPQVSGQKQ